MHFMTRKDTKQARNGQGKIKARNNIERRIEKVKTEKNKLGRRLELGRMDERSERKKGGRKEARTTKRKRGAQECKERKTKI